MNTVTLIGRLDTDPVAALGSPAAGRTCGWTLAGERGVMHRAGRPAHEVDGFGTRDRPAMSVSHTSASIPVALRMARTSRRSSASLRRERSGRECFFDPADGASLAERQVRRLGWIRFEREAEHGPLLWFGVDDEARERVDHEVEPLAGVVRRVRREQRFRRCFRVGRVEGPEGAGATASCAERRTVESSSRVRPSRS